MKRFGVEELAVRLRLLKETFDAATARKVRRQTKPSESHMVFALAGELCAWPTVNLAEVVVNRRIYPVPASMEALCGVINHRDRVMTVTRLHHPLHLCPAAPDERNPLLVTRGLKVNTAILTDGILGITAVAADAIKPRPISLDSAASELIAGEFIYRGKLLVILNPAAVSG